MTGGSCAGDRASPFSTLEAWQQQLVMVVIDEGQQYGGDREVASVAMLPPTCMVVWTGDAQQTPGGIAKGPSQIAITRRQLISRKHAWRCPQDEYTPHTLFQALMKLVSHLDLAVVADLEAMFQLAVPELGPLWNPTEMSEHRACLDLLTRVCPDCKLRWDAPTADDVARLPTNIESTIVGEEVHPTTLHLLAHICAALDSVPEWLQWVQAPDTLSTAGAAGNHSWGLMLPTSTRTPGVNYTSSVAVRYPPLNREVDGKWIVGTHSSGGLEGLVGGYQLVIWKKPSKEFMHARGADLSAVIEPLLHDVMDIYRGESDVLVMCARNEDRDQLLTDSICRGHPQIKVQSVASSAGATATSSIVNQPFNGHLNGRPSDPFDQEECYARCTVAATRAQSLTVIISQLDMAGMMGMMQVLAARARPIHQVYHGATTWTLPRHSRMQKWTHGTFRGYPPGQSNPCLRWP